MGIRDILSMAQTKRIAVCGPGSSVRPDHRDFLAALLCRDLSGDPVFEQEIWQAWIGIDLWRRESA
ncbi:hypothetical protein [Sphingobium yanoikuyae]|uniref:hypothetical protein n=1 Tax=Sphingobium yanoikuyae TaxID=13690 RepID=UPI00138DDD36|nr:hypothetical protein [Sphingobium yanoikuyae]